MITKLINRLDFAFLISILVSLCGLWLFIYDMIIDLTYMDGYEVALPLSICHYALTIYIIMLLYICFQKSLIILEDADNIKTNKFVESLITVFIKTWPYIIIVSIVMILLSNCGINGDTILTIDVLFLFSLFLAILVKLGLSKNTKAIITYLLSSVIIPIGYFAFLIIISNSSMKVEVSTDKMYYTANDREIILTVDTHGYLWTPACSITRGDDFPQHVESYGDCFWVSTRGLEDHVLPPYINITYENTMFYIGALTPLMNRKEVVKEIYYKKTRR